MSPVKHSKVVMLVRRVIQTAVLAMVLLVVPSASSTAQESMPQTVDEFVPMSQTAPREVLPATPLVFYAYSFVWLALLGYVFLMWQRMARVEKELADVQRRLQEGSGGR